MYPAKDKIQAPKASTKSLMVLLLPRICQQGLPWYPWHLAGIVGNHAIPMKDCHSSGRFHGANATYLRSHWCSIRKIKNKGISVRIYWGCLSVKQWKPHGSGTVVAQDPWNDAVSFWFICCWCLIKRALHGMNASWMDDFDMLIIIESWRAKARPVVWKVLKKKLVRTCMHVVNKYINHYKSKIYIYI